MNNVINILEDYLKFGKLKNKLEFDSLSSEEKADLRLKNDEDADYYYNQIGLEKEEALKADTIISFWTPYKRLLELEVGLKYYKTEKSHSALIRQIKATWLNDSTSKIVALNKKMSKFAEVYYTKENFMLLPESRMNIERYQVSEDRIDLSLYECFEKGSLGNVFKNDSALSSWIRKERLDSMFLDNKISKDNVYWLISEDKPKFISEMSAIVVYDYLNKALNLINKRNN